MTLPSMEFGTPWALAALPLAGLLWLLARQSAAVSAPRLWWMILGVRISVFTCLILALSDPRISSRSAEKHVVWVVDASRSAGSSALEAALRYSVESGLPAGSQSWVRFGGNSTVQATPPNAGDSQSVDPDETDLASALRFASAVFPSDKARLLVAFSDGMQTRGDSTEVGAELARTGVVAFGVLTPPPDEAEVLVRSVSAPPEVRRNEPFVVRSELYSSRGQPVGVEVMLDDIRVGSRDLALEPGLTSVEFTLALPESKTSRVSVLVSAQEDTIATNNSATTLVSAGGTSQVLLVSENPSPALGAALEPQGISVDQRPAAGVPEDAAQLQAFDAIVLDNVSARALGPSRLRALASYVRDFGGGLVMLGGREGFGQGGYDQTPVGEILPLRSEFESQKETPSLALVAALDRSGSMNGEKLTMAKTAALGAIELLSARDLAGVIAFDGEASWVAEIQPAQNLGAIRPLVEKIVAGGGTNVAAGLRLALQGLRTAPAAIRHAILLSDGVSIPGPYAEIAETMRAEGISLSTVGVGSDADTTLLDKLARLGGGRFYFTDSPDAIPAIFARETSIAARPGFREQPTKAVEIRAAPFLAGIRLAEAPMLLGFVSTKLAPGADLWLETESGSPLLATNRAGLGQVAAFASDTRDVWASEWLTWPEFGKFWAQVIRSVQRPADLRLLPATLALEGEDLVLTVEAVDALGRPIKDAKGLATLSFPDGETATGPLREIAPGTLEGRWPSRGSGAHTARVLVSTGDRLIGTRQLGYFQSAPKEQLLRGSDPKPLQALAESTGGTFNPSPQEVASANVAPREVSREIWPWFAWAALALFLADVGLRRRGSRMAV